MSAGERRLSVQKSSTGEIFVPSFWTTAKSCWACYPVPKPTFRLKATRSEKFHCGDSFRFAFLSQDLCKQRSFCLSIWQKICDTLIVLTAGYGT